MAGPLGVAFGPVPPFHPPNWLPSGWTEHKAPDGMSYFYNATTGTSSWVRPTMLPPGGPGIAPPPPPPGVSQPPPGVPGYVNQQPLHPPGVVPPPFTATVTKEELGKGKKSKKVKKEKAIKKTQVLESPWFIVVTNLENTFFFNKETKVSIWVPTPELEIILAKMGQVETEKLEAERKAKEEEEQARLQALKRTHEGDSGQDSDKRSKSEANTNQGTEMTEDDVAWQLAAMEGMMDDQDQDQDQDMQSQDDDEDDDEDDNEAVRARLRMLQGSSSSGSQPGKTAPVPTLDISPDNVQEREMAFIDMMRDRGVTQFDIWEKAMAKIELDPRIYLIPDKKQRQELFESFCVIRAREIKEAKEKENKEKEDNEKENRDDGDRRDKDRRPRESKSYSTPSSSSTSSKPEDVYRKLVEDYTTKTSTWLDFMTKYRVDPRFLGLKPGSLRESIFRQYLSDLKKGIIQPKSKSHSSDRNKRSSSSSRSSSKKYKATEDEIGEFMSLLKETKKDILHEHKHSSSVEWRKIKKLIDRDRRYDAVGSSTERELLFREYADRVIQRRD
ncbi:transcription elongation regulator [Gamsiella multidivaricata]|nr:transcription elongation regulator [Gamsiella multidivaricata]